MSYATQQPDGNELNRLLEGDLPVHDWYRFILSYPPHLVRQYIEKFQTKPGMVVLDPFCGTGTTLVECMKLGINSVGIEPNPVVHFAASVKTDLNIKEEELNQIRQAVEDVEAIFLEKISKIGVSDLVKNYTLDDDSYSLLISGSITPYILSKCLLLLECIDVYAGKKSHQFMRLIFAKHLVHSFSNLRFGPEIGVSGKKITEIDVLKIWKRGMINLIRDLQSFDVLEASGNVILGDARNISQLIDDNSIDAVITSPPYPNEKDYSRTTRLEAVILGFTTNKSQLKSQKMTMLSSNTKTVYAAIDDYKYVKENFIVQELSREIESRRLELNKNSGFEKLYHKVVQLYFGGMAKHLEDLKPKLKSGAKLAYVVGDQSSYFQIPIRTGNILAEIAGSLGYEVVSIDLFRTRFASAISDYLNEEVVCLKVPDGGFEMHEDRIVADSSEISLEVSVKDANRYSRILEYIFKEAYKPGLEEVEFSRSAIEDAAQANEITLPKNLGDVIYSFKYRTSLPRSITDTITDGREWVIVNKGRAKYAFVLRKFSRISPDRTRIARKIPDSTPSIVEKYTSVDEQALLTKLRYNRIIDLFSGAVCYSLQNHLRTTVKGMGQVETDEIYVGVDKEGNQYVFPVQAKGGSDELGIVQIEQDIALCKEKFPELKCRPIAAQFMSDKVIALFEFGEISGEVGKIKESHFELVSADKIDKKDLENYKTVGKNE